MEARWSGMFIWRISFAWLANMFLPAEGVQLPKHESILSFLKAADYARSLSGHRSKFRWGHGALQPHSQLLQLAITEGSLCLSFHFNEIPTCFDVFNNLSVQVWFQQCFCLITSLVNIFGYAMNDILSRELQNPFCLSPSFGFRNTFALLFPLRTYSAML